MRFPLLAGSTLRRAATGSLLLSLAPCTRRATPPASAVEPPIVSVAATPSATASAAKPRVMITAPQPVPPLDIAARPPGRSSRPTPEAAGPASSPRTNAACSQIAPSSLYRFEAANYWSDATKILENQFDPQACARACAADQRCQIASFCDSTATGGWANKCVLRSKRGPRHTEQAGICSWVKADSTK